MKDTSKPKKKKKDRSNSLWMKDPKLRVSDQSLQYYQTKVEK